jgi:prepilin-type N-terminal cleavage/methylation domain-containing protein
LVLIIKNKNGVTLIEIICVILLTAILTAGAGMGIITITQGYSFANKNAQTAQKTNIAMTRMSRELQEIILVSDAQTDSITFTSILGTRTIGFDSNAIKISENSDPVSMGDILIDNITSLDFTFKKSSGDWDIGTDNIQALTGITISFNVTRSDISSDGMTFTTTVYLRNNQNSGGTI